MVHAIALFVLLQAQDTDLVREHLVRRTLDHSDDTRKIAESYYRTVDIDDLTAKDGLKDTFPGCRVLHVRWGSKKPEHGEVMLVTPKGKIVGAVGINGDVSATALRPLLRVPSTDDEAADLALTILSLSRLGLKERYQTPVKEGLFLRTVGDLRMYRQKPDMNWRVDIDARGAFQGFTPTRGFVALRGTVTPPSGDFKQWHFAAADGGSYDLFPGVNGLDALLAGLKGGETVDIEADLPMSMCGGGMPPDGSEPKKTWRGQPLLVFHMVKTTK